jgi:antitoxin MazE
LARWSSSGFLSASVENNNGISDIKGEITMTTTIQKWGNSHGVRLSKSILDSLLLQENDSVEVTAQDDTIVIKRATRKRRAKKSLEERFEDYSGDYRCADYNWGEPVGNEVW